MISKLNYNTFSNYLKKVFTRFPVSMLLCLLMVGLWIFFIASEGDKNNFFPFIIASSLGLIYTLAIHLTFESHSVKVAIKIPVWVITIAGLVAYSLYLRNVFEGNDISYCVLFTILGLGVIGILMVSVAQVWSNKDNQRYLLFNRSLFTSYLLSAAYTFVLFIGFVLAVLALDNLFGVNINAKVYGYLAVIFIGLFFTTYFLASIPDPKEEIETKPSKGLKIFAQYILVPVIMVYALIILAYSIKNIFSPGLTEIWTQELIWWFYVAGYFTFLINLAVEVPASLTSFGRFGKGFLYILVPMSLLVLFSITMNMHSEGITELKYIVAAMSLYLFIIALYLLINKNKDYRWVSGLLILFTLVSAFGPLSACRTSIRDQEKKLYSILEKNNIIQSGNLNITNGEISNEDLNSIQSRMNFLNNRRDGKILNLESGPVTYSQLEEIFGNKIIPENRNFYIPFKNFTEVPLDAYDYYIAYQDYQDNTLTGRHLQLSPDHKWLELKDQQKVIKSFNLNKILSPILGKDPDMINRKITLDDSDFLLDFFFSELSYHYEGDDFKIDYMRGFGLLSNK